MTFVSSGSKQTEFSYQSRYIGLHFHLSQQPNTSLHLLLEVELQSFLTFWHRLRPLLHLKQNHCIGGTKDPRVGRKISLVASN